MAFSSPQQGLGNVPPPSAPGVSGILPGQQAVNTTRILSLIGFSKDLKTRDIQSIFVDYEDDRGGYRIKWLDDTGCLIVFNDAITAKRAFLNLLANPHPHLQPSTSADGVSVVPKLAPYTAEDASQIAASVANRPRSRSISVSGPGGNSTTGSHNRRMSNSSSGALHSRMVSSTSSGSLSGQANGTSGGGSLGRTFGRQTSLSQHQMQAIMDEAAIAEEPTEDDQVAVSNGPKVNGSSSPPSPTAASNAPSGGSIDWVAYQQQQQQNNSSSSPSRTRLPSSASNSQIGGFGNFTSPPISPERGMGAHSPTRLRRMVMQSRS